MKTLVTFPGGSEIETAKILAVLPSSQGEILIVTDVTPFHPLDPWWPDQPSDIGTLHLNGVSLPVRAASVVGWQGGKFSTEGLDLVRRNELGWNWLVAHRVPADALVRLEPGSIVRLSVDHRRRTELAAAHTACHVASLAFNHLMNEFWRKPISVDTREYFNSDQELIIESRIEPLVSSDVYRIGKGARKKGFLAEAFWDVEMEFGAALTDEANRLMRSIHSITVVPGRSHFEERRVWRAFTDDGVLEIGCGGVHLSNSDLVDGITVTLERDREQGLVEMRTRVSLTQK